MNIDLFLGPHGEAGLLCDRIPGPAIGGVIFDAQTMELTIEYADGGDTFHLNIPVEAQYRDLLLFAHKIYIGMLKDGLIGDTLHVPMLYLNDPYGSDFGQGSPLAKAQRSLIGFEQFMKRCDTAQPVHRADLGDEHSAGCVLRGMDPRALEFVPQLVRQRMLETGPRAAPTVSAPGMHIGGGGSSRSGPSAAKGIMGGPHPPRETKTDE